MMHQPESSEFAWGLETPTMAESTESPTKRRRTTAHRCIEQDLQHQVKTKGPTRHNRAKTWPCDASRSSQQLSPGMAATLSMARSI
jgi:hypothetical protein